ncbi:MAG: 3-phosphoshikimate 1-carboxyvinyltransferase [Deltaproteobacteria bacterium]|nr:MAG: 3-phosphoshikimate 1-carboxyvinyltransferase [Deltaproteobacteria bacterium]
MSEVVVVGPARRGLAGTVAVPGDKSIAHRALLLGALADGVSRVVGFPGGADTRSTLGAVRALGVRAEETADVVLVEGAGPELGERIRTTIDCGNSGTTMRLAAGLAAGAHGTVVLDGDASLRRRPMERVAEPLRRMGAEVATTDGRAPLTVRGGALGAIDWVLPVPSAQVKSAVLLAGLRARGTTRVREPHPSRDHTERLLPAFGVEVTREGEGVAVAGGQPLRAAEVMLPGDASSAAYFVVAALLVAGSELRLANVGVNPTRSGYLHVLRRMGATIDVVDVHEPAGEPRATLVVRASPLHATAIEAAEVPALIDELPVLAVAAALAEGTTTIAGAAELRVKESDRLAALEQLGRLGVGLSTTADGLVVRGSAGRPLHAGRIASLGDHRIAMAFAVAGLVADAGVEIVDPACAAVSFPGFFERLAALGATVERR